MRAGVLEEGSVALLRRVGVAGRMDREGIVHDGTLLSARNRSFRIDFADRVGGRVMIWGQTEVTADLYDARAAAGLEIRHEVDGVTIHDADTDAPFVTWTEGGTGHRRDCDFVAGCDGFHGVSRQTIPQAARREFERAWPFGWLGLLSETPPAAHELIYANYARGFALCSMRNAHRSRNYIQVPITDTAEGWSDDAFWDELRRRIPQDAADGLVTGPALEKTLAPLRSFVSEPMRWGRLFLCGDAAHIVPPTGAKGLNLAAGDVALLSEALTRWYADRDEAGLAAYSDRALAGVWKAIRFSWWFTRLMHRFPEDGALDLRLQEAELDRLEDSAPAQQEFAANYVGLPR